jgi:uncharacterized protein (DUF3820 family)
MEMPFGRYVGRDLKYIPLGYLVWVLENCRNASPMLLDAIRQMLNSLEIRGLPDPPQRFPPQDQS